MDEPPATVKLEVGKKPHFSVPLFLKSQDGAEAGAEVTEVHP